MWYNTEGKFISALFRKMKGKNTKTAVNTDYRANN